MAGSRLWQLVASVPPIVSTGCGFRDSYGAMNPDEDFLFASEAIDLILRAGEYASIMCLEEASDAPESESPEDDQ